MKLISSTLPKTKQRVYRATIDSEWINNELCEAKVLVEECAIVRATKERVELCRPCTATSGMRFTDPVTLEKEFHKSAGAAILHLYARVQARLEACENNQDVATGKISEAAALLMGLN